MRMSGIEGKHVLITGAAGVIASGICNALAENGASLTLLDVAQDRLQNLIADIKKTSGAKVRTSLQADLTNAVQVEQMLADAEQHLGPVDVVIHAAYPRTSDWSLKLEHIPVESWKKNIDDHLSGTFVLAQQAGIKMATRKKGNIILFSSIYGLVGPDFNIYKGLDHMTMPAGYSVIKGGVSNFTRYLASYWGGSGIRVNAVCPGGVFDNQAPQFVASYNEKVPMRRMAERAEIIGPTLFLASDLSSYVTGVNLPVDGGWTAI